MEERTYILRYAAGTYWLFPVPRRGEAYRAPLQLNRMGADIVNMAGRGLGVGQIIKELCQAYEARDKESCLRIERDVKEFCKMLRTHGMEIIGEKGVSIL